MMKLIYKIVCLSLCIMQISCIKDEAPNAEADIIACTVPADILRRSPVSKITGLRSWYGRKPI